MKSSRETRNAFVADDQSQNWYKYWADVRNTANGYASEFSRLKSDSKIMEASVAEEWAAAMNSNFGLCVQNIEMSDSDPPDLFAEIDGRRASIELTELIEGEHRARAKKGETQHAGK